LTVVAAISTKSARPILWLASRFVTPLSGKTRISVESIGDPVHLGGLLVRAGDLVVGDETGIVILPRAQIATVLARAEAIVEKDRMIEGAPRAGKWFSEAAHRRRLYLSEPVLK